MTTTQHPHADHLAAIAQHLENTPEATAPGQSAGSPYTAEEGDYTRRLFHDDHCGGITFSFTITAYEHTTDISVDVQHGDIRASIMVPGDTPADVITHAAMSALHTTIDTITTPESHEVPRG